MRTAEPGAGPSRTRGHTTGSTSGRGTEKENDMTPQAEKRQKEDWKLLLIIGGSLVAIVVTIASLARLSSDWESKEAAAAEGKAPPAVESIAPVEIEEFEPVVEEIEAVERVESGSPEGFMVDPDADFVAMGSRAYGNREWDVAAAYWQADVNARPERAYSYYMLGLSQWKAGNLDEAAAALERSGELNGRSIKTFINLSRVLNEDDEFERALDAAEMARQIDPEDPTALYLQARSLRNLGRIDDAVVALEQALAFDQEYGHAWNLLGLIDIHRGRNAEAADSLKKAAACEPEVAYIHGNLGRALELSGSYAEAAEAYRAALALDPEHPSAALCLARVEPQIIDTAPTEPEGEAVASAGDDAPSEGGL
jgi:tetratricopeptide (TPR) repeat protein